MWGGLIVLALAYFCLRITRIGRSFSRSRHAKRLHPYGPTLRRSRSDAQPAAVASRIDSTATSHRRSINSAGMAGAGISTTTSPNGRRMTPRLRAASVTWCPIRRAGGKGSLESRLETSSIPTITPFCRTSPTKGNSRSTLSCGFNPTGVRVHVVEDASIVEQFERGQGGREPSGFPVYVWP